MAISREHGHRTGHVDKLDFDQAVVEGLGAVLDAEKNQYFLSLLNEAGKGIFIRPEGSEAPVEITRALVVHKKPEPTNVKDILPIIVVNCDDVHPAPNRIAGIVEQYRLPAEGAKRVAVGPELGWTDYEVKEQEWPWDFTYTIECWSRYRAVAQMLWQMAMVKYPLYGSVRVVDGIGNERIYAAFQESTADLTEIASLVERYCGLTLTLRVEGELTNERVPYDAAAFTGHTVPVDSSGGGGGGGGIDGNADPGPGGLVGDGLPNVRVTFTRSDE